MFPEEEPFATPENLFVGDTLWIAIENRHSTHTEYSDAKPYEVVDVNPDKFLVVEKEDGRLAIPHYMTNGEPVNGRSAYSHRVFRTYTEFTEHQDWLRNIQKSNTIRDSLFEDIHKLKDSDLQYVKDTLEYVFKSYDHPYASTD